MRSTRRTLLWPLLLQHFEFVNWWARGFIFWCHEQVIRHRSGHFEYLFCFLQAGAVEKIKTNIKNSTHPNQCATKNRNITNNFHFYFRSLIALSSISTRENEKSRCKKPQKALELWSLKGRISCLEKAYLSRTFSKKVSHLRYVFNQVHYWGFLLPIWIFDWSLKTFQKVLVVGPNKSGTVVIR